MFAVTGRRTTIVRELETITQESVVRLVGEPGQWSPPIPLWSLGEPHRYVLAAGLLRNGPSHDLPAALAMESAFVNMVWPIGLCEWLLENDPNAWICVIGSESATNGSFDRYYGAAKAGLHQYVLTRTGLRPDQRLLAVSPGIIRDSGMTERRHDYPEVLEKRQSVSARQVAQAVGSVLWGATRVTNRIIPVPFRQTFPDARGWGSL